MGPISSECPLLTDPQRGAHDLGRSARSRPLGNGHVLSRELAKTAKQVIEISRRKHFIDLSLSITAVALKTPNQAYAWSLPKRGSFATTAGRLGRRRRMTEQAPTALLRQFLLSLDHQVRLGVRCARSGLSS